jgi:hypothetical protein
MSNVKAHASLNSRCCYITVDSAMAASQSGFCSYKFSIHKKTSIMQIMAKNITIFIYLIFYYREIVKLGHFMTLSLSYANTDMWRSRCKIHRIVAAPNSHSIFKHSVWWCISTTILQRVSLLVWWSFWSLPLANRVHTWAFLVNGSHSPWWNCHPRSPTSDLHYRLSHFFSFPIPLLYPLFHLIFLSIPLQIFIIDYLTSSVFPFPFCLSYSISFSYLFHFISSL